METKKDPNASPRVTLEIDEALHLALKLHKANSFPEAAHLYGRIYQTVTQRLSEANFTFANELLRLGRLGKIHTVRAHIAPWDAAELRHDWLPAEPEPGMDECAWDLWLGPTPWRPYNSAYTRGGWRGFFDFHGGGILEWGAHTVDLCNWAGTNDTQMPVLYEPTPKGCIATYASGLKLVMRDEGWMGLGTCSARYEGEEGWVETGDSGRLEFSSGQLRAEQRVFTEAGTSAVSHVKDWIDAIKTRRPAHSNADVVAMSHIICHCAYIAWQLGRPLEFDPVKVEFPNDADANRMRSRALRDPWHA